VVSFLPNSATLDTDMASEGEVGLKDVSSTTFGYLIAFLLPGLVAYTVLASGRQKSVVFS
jgi:hypothetical protein